MTAKEKNWKSAESESYPAGNVVNLSKNKFSRATSSLLNKNLKFVPTQTNYSIKSFDQVIAKSYRRTKLIAHSLKTNHVNQVQNEEDIFKFPSNKDWLPGNVNHTIQIFTEAIFKDIDIERSTQKIEQNRT